jgi:hypothetical protein
MTGVKHARGSIATLAFVATLAGCGGAASAPFTASNALASAGSQMQLGALVSDTKCPSDKGVSVNPCAVTLTAAKRAVTATTKGPKGGTFTVDDKGCQARLIATIKRLGHTYHIGAGAHGKGQCVATFVDYSPAKKRLGAAKLIIVNDVDKVL